MTAVHDHRLSEMEAAGPRGAGLAWALAHSVSGAVRRLFRPLPDGGRLSRRLRIDAGMDEAEHERLCALRAPLIR